MKHLKLNECLKLFKIFESVLSKEELIDKLKYYSNWLYTYINDSNRITKGGINLSFSYNTNLDIIEIFKFVDELNYKSSDEEISFICYEYITWSNYFLEDRWRGDRYRKDLQEFNFDYNYLNYTDDYKNQNRIRLYKQEYNLMAYIYVGQKIKKMISGTIWDIPEKVKFSQEDKDFILNTLVYELDLDSDDIKKFSEMIDKSIINNKSDSVRINIPIIKEMDKYSDFIKRLRKYFGCVIVKKGYQGYYTCHQILIPFYIK